MNIGIDIDGVLCSEDLFQLTYGIKYCYQKEISLINLSPFSSDTKEKFGWSSEEDKLFWKANYLQYLTTSEFVYPNASEVIQSLYQHGHNIFIISRRTQSILNQLDINENIENLTRNWLQKNNIPFHQLILTEKPKCSLIQRLKISLMIDDDPELLIKLSRYIEVIGFRSYCNLQHSLTGIPMVSSWTELENKLKLIIYK